MADEISVTSSLQIRFKSNSIQKVDYQSRPTQFKDDLVNSNVRGPLPGVVRVLRTGTVVDLSGLTIPGYYRISGQFTDPGNYVEIGIYDPGLDVFYPLNEIGAGQSYVGKFTRNLLEEYSGTGTATTTASNQLMLKAFNANVDVLLEVFDTHSA